VKRKTLVYGATISFLATMLAACGATPPTPQAAAPAQQATAAPLPTVTLPTSQPTELSLGVSGSGEIKAEQDADLVFLAQGTVAEVKVDEGAVVKQGDLLAILDTRPFDQQVQQAEAALANAQAQDAALTEAPRKADAVAAAAQVRQAQEALNAVKNGPKSQDIQQAEAGLTAAQANLQMTRDKLSLGKTAAESQMQQAVEMLTQAQARYAQAKGYWDHVQETGNDPVVPNVTDPKTGKKVPNTLSAGARANYAAQFQQAEAAMRQAEQGVRLAQANFDNARQSEIVGIQAAEQQVVQAQSVVDKLKAPPDAAQLGVLAVDLR
jgi:HlyD family secretion protein